MGLPPTTYMHWIVHANNDCSVEWFCKHSHFLNCMKSSGALLWAQLPYTFTLFFSFPMKERREESMMKE